MCCFSYDLKVGFAFDMHEKDGQIIIWYVEKLKLPVLIIDGNDTKKIIPCLSVSTVKKKELFK